MARLVWGVHSNKKYETGIDRGVLYPLSGAPVAWNGLISLEESVVGGEREAYYFDGRKYMEWSTPRFYQSILSAYSAPIEFLPSLGERSIVPGLILTRQPRTSFGLTYRTLIDEQTGYRIHLIYNAVANMTGRQVSTLTAPGTPPIQNWRIDAIPPRVSGGYYPSAHIILDSTRIDGSVLSGIEDVLYGTVNTNPRMITVNELEIALA